MKIRPKISKFQQGGTVPQWYLDLYRQHALGGWNNTLRYDYANQNLNSNDHYNAGNLETVYRKQNVYTGTPEVVRQDIQSFYNTDGGNMTAEEFVNFYNQNAEKIRNHWASDQTYNASTAGDHNKLYRRMFQNRSNTSLNPGSEYNIGYQEGVTKGGYDIQDIEGSSTWLRRMDRYEHEFDPNNPDQNRIHEITLKDGSKALVYKKANGDIGLLSSSPANPNQPQDPNQPQNPNQPLNNPINPENPEGGKVPVSHRDINKFDMSKLGYHLRQTLPGMLEVGRLAGTLANNAAIYDAKEKGILANLQKAYLTHRQLLGDEATKQAYYRRGAQGQTKASRAFTSDADRQMAYQMEAKRAADELRAQGDLADNAEIRRTSDESNQHQWANTQRRTDVANYNMQQLNYAKAAKQDLIAQKHAADWTSINNYLQGIEYRQRQKQAESKAIQDQIWALDEQERIANDPEYTELRQKYSDAWDAARAAGKNPATDPTVIAAKKAYESKQYQLRRQQLYNLQQHSNGLWLAKSGIKLTYKKKNDLLYKTARDAVDHFRKMSKMSDESTRKSRTKQVRLAPHPGGTRSYQQGGVAPFSVFTPIAVGGESSTQTTLGADSLTGLGGRKGSSSSSKSDKDPKLEMIKDLFSKLEGLPSDVNGVYTQMYDFLSKAQAFGEEITTDDLSTLYLQQLQQINNIKFSKAAYDKAKEQATSNDALNEFAVDSTGRVAVQTQDGKISFVNWNDVKSSKGKYNPLTNNDLLNLRAYSNDQSFNDGIFNVVNNGIGISKIADFIKGHLPSLGDSDQTIEGYTKKQSDQIRKGFEIMLQDAPDGDYHYSHRTKDQQQQVQAALGYISSILPRNMKAILGIHADLQGISSTDMLQALLGSQSSISDELKITAVTGKASSGSGTGSRGSGKGSENSAGLAFVLGQGPREVVEFNTGTSYAVRTLGIRGVLQTKSNENLGQGATLQDATKSQQGGYLKWGQATFGGSKLNSSAYSHIILNDSTIMGVDLPVKTNLQGNEVPDFSMLKAMEKADEEIRTLNISDKDYAKINEIYRKYSLPPKYDSSGNLNQSQYKRFAAIQVTLDEDSLQDKNSILSDEITIAEDSERELYEQIVKKTTDDKKYSLSNGLPILGWGKEELYKGTVFVPYDEDIAFAALSSGEPFKQNLPDNTSDVQRMQYAPASMSYKAPDKTLSQIINQ